MAVKLTFEAENETELTRLLQELVAERAQTVSNRPGTTSIIGPPEEPKTDVWFLTYGGNLEGADAFEDRSEAYQALRNRETLSTRGYRFILRHYNSGGHYRDVKGPVIWQLIYADYEPYYYTTREKADTAIAEKEAAHLKVGKPFRSYTLIPLYEH